MSDIKKELWVIAGTFFVILGILGIFIPIMPSTVFLLLGASCYARGSARFYNWLLNNRWLGSVIRDYREGRGILLRQKLLTMIILWMTIGISAVFFVDAMLIKILLLVVAIGVNIHLICIKTRQHDTPVTYPVSQALPHETAPKSD